jgi:hypothetical protein
MIFDSVQKVYIGDAEVTKALLQTVEVYSSAVTPTFPAGALAFWKLADLTDSSGNGNNLINTNNVQFVAGKIGNCAEFDGSNRFTSELSQALGQSFSLSMWLYPTIVNGYKNILTWRTSGTGSIGYDGAIYWYNDNGGFLVLSSNGIIQANNWYHICLICNNNAITIYVNGISVATGTDNNTRTATALTIGAYIGGGENIVGKLDATGIWTRALSEQEIQILYNNGNGLEP